MTDYSKTIATLEATARRQALALETTRETIDALKALQGQPKAKP